MAVPMTASCVCSWMVGSTPTAASATNACKRRCRKRRSPNQSLSPNQSFRTCLSQNCCPRTALPRIASQNCFRTCLSRNCGRPGTAVSELPELVPNCPELVRLSESVRFVPELRCATPVSGPRRSPANCLEWAHDFTRLLQSRDAWLTCAVGSHDGGWPGAARLRSQRGSRRGRALAASSGCRGGGGQAKTIIATPRRES